MTNYVYDASGETQFTDWNDPSSWYGGVVPNSLDADVIIPMVTFTSGGGVYTSYISIDAGESFEAASVTLDSNFISLYGNLSVTGLLDIEDGGEIDLHGGTLSFGSIANNGYDIQGFGQVDCSGTLSNAGMIIGDGTLTINAAGFSNTGSVSAFESTTVINAPDAGDGSSYANGALMGGTYEVGSGGILDLNLGGVITIDSATIIAGDLTTGGSQINSFDPVSGTYQSLQTTLTEISRAGRLEVQDSFATTNTLTVDGELTLNEGTVTSALAVASDGIVDGNGTLTGPITNDGVIVSETSAADVSAGGAMPADLVVRGAVAGTGTLEVGAGIVSYEYEIHPPQRVVQRATLELAGPTAQNVLFADDTGILVLDDPASFSGTITAQFPAPDEDRVVLDGISLGDVTAYDYAGTSSGGILTIDEGQTSQTLSFNGDYTTASFLLSAGAQPLSNSPPSLDISIACYARGTAIRTDRGNVPVEELQIGDRVATFAGGGARPIRWIGRRAYNGRFLASNPAVQPILFKAGSLDRYQPRRDLRVSPKHAMFLHGCLVPAECLVNGTSVLRDTACAEIEYFHVELDSHDVILAEDAPSETFVDDNSRNMFHNASDYRARYGDRPAAPAAYCAPRIEDGEMLERIRRGIDDRAARTQAAIRTLHGRIDGWDGHVVRGWARDPDRPDVPACLEVLAGGRIVARTVANLFRDDLQRAGYGSGCHGFHLALPDQPAGLSIEVRRAADAATLEVLRHHRAA